MKIKTLNGNDDFALDELNGDYFDILAVGFNPDERIKYSKELRGETNTLKNLAEATKDGGALIYAVDTDNYGIIKHSAAVFENGKLLGISDMTESYSDTPYMPGANGKLYDLHYGKVGLAVGDDVLSYELMKSFAVCGAEAIVAIIQSKIKETSAIVIRAYSYLLGLPVILIGENETICSDPKGRLTKKDENGIFTLTPLSEYALKTVKIRFERN